MQHHYRQVKVKVIKIMSQSIRDIYASFHVSNYCTIQYM
jgi:hypothetical protein